MPQSSPFSFEITELFKQLKILESSIGLNGFDVSSITDRITSLEQSLQTISNSYVTRTYVDNKLLEKVNKIGDTLMGELFLANIATQPLHPVAKQQLDEYIDNIVQIGNLDW